MSPLPLKRRNTPTGCLPNINRRILRRPCSNVAVLYMVIEEYIFGPEPVYERAAARGRLLPEGLRYIDSWVVDGRLDRCFQLMETDNPELLDLWRAQWADLVEFDVYPVITSSEAAQRTGARRAQDRPELPVYQRPAEPRRRVMAL